MAPGMGAAPGAVVDKTIICPPALVGKMIGPAGATIKKMAADTGAQVNLDRDVAQGGGKAVIITAADPMIREKAKAHIQNWIQENSASSGMGGMGQPMQFGQAPQMSPPSGLGQPLQPGLRPPLGGMMRPQGQAMPSGGFNTGMPQNFGGMQQGGGRFPQMTPPSKAPPSMSPPGMGMGGGMGGGMRPPMQPNFVPNTNFGGQGGNMAPGAGMPNFGKVQQQGWQQDQNYGGGY